MGTSNLIPSNGKNGGWEKLTPMQTKFVEALLADPDFNLSRAAEAAGYSSPSVAANRLMHTDYVARLIRKEIQKRSEKVGVSKDDVLRELFLTMMRQPDELVDEEGHPISLKQLPKELARQIAGFKVREFYDKTTGELDRVEYEYKLETRTPSIELLARHLGMLNDKLKVEADIGPKLMELILSKVSPKPVIDAEVIDVKALTGEL